MQLSYFLVMALLNLFYLLRMLHDQLFSKFPINLFFLLKLCFKSLISCRMGSFKLYNLLLMLCDKILNWLSMLVFKFLNLYIMLTYQVRVSFLEQFNLLGIW